MAEYRISVTMDIVGTGDTPEAAQGNAGAQYVEMVQAVNGAYGGEAAPLDGDGQPTPAAVAFTRGRINAYLSEVVVGWRRSRAAEAAEAAVSSDGITME